MQRLDKLQPLSSETPSPLARESQIVKRPADGDIDGGCFNAAADEVSD